jgi:hypothetical protein
MRTRTLVVAAATALTGAALAAAPLHSADAAHPLTHRDLVAPTITVNTTGQHGTTLSASSTTPGGVVFDLVGKGGVDVVTFNDGYSIADLAKDAKKLFSGDVKTVRRVDKEVVFWGGEQASLKGGAEFGIDLPAGTYYVLNIDKGSFATLTVTGTPTGAALPATSGKVSYVHTMDYKVPSSLPKNGWIQFDNKSTEPHFTDFQKVKQGTTAQQVAAYLKGGAQGQPAFALGEFHGNLPLSPGHGFEWYIDATKGEYATLCWWPSKQTGMPHALMGMFALTQLK